MSKKLALVIGTVGVLAILLAAAGAAYAQGPEPPDEDLPGFGRGGGRMQGGRGRRMGGSLLMDATVEATGLSAEEIMAALQEGQTWAEIAEDAGSNSQAILDAFRSQAEARLEEMLEQISERLDEPWTPPSGGGPRQGHLAEVVAEATGLTTEEVVAALQDGQSVADIADAAGVELQTIADALIEQQAARLEEAVEAGRLTQEQADEMLDEMSENILEHLEDGQPFGGRMGNGFPQEGGFRRGGGQRGDSTPPFLSDTQ